MRGTKISNPWTHLSSLSTLRVLKFSIGTTSDAYILLLSPSSVALRAKRSKACDLSRRHMVDEMRPFECRTRSIGEYSLQISATFTPGCESITITDIKFPDDLNKGPGRDFDTSPTVTYVSGHNLISIMLEMIMIGDLHPDISRLLLRWSSE